MSNMATRARDPPRSETGTATQAAAVVHSSASTSRAVSRPASRPAPPLPSSATSQIQTPVRHKRKAAPPSSSSSSSSSGENEDSEDHHESSDSGSTSSSGTSSASQTSRATQRNHSRTSQAYMGKQSSSKATTAGSSSAQAAADRSYAISTQKGLLAKDKVDEKYKDAARARLNELLEEQEQQGGKSSAPSGHQLAQWKRHLKSPKTTATTKAKIRDRLEDAGLDPYEWSTEEDEDEDEEEGLSDAQKALKASLSTITGKIIPEAQVPASLKARLTTALKSFEQEELERMQD